jgi:hypothetical protein
MSLSSEPVVVVAVCDSELHHPAQHSPLLHHDHSQHLHFQGTLEVPNSHRISYLDSSLGRVLACGAGGRKFAPRP